MKLKTENNKVSIAAALCLLSVCLLANASQARADQSNDASAPSQNSEETAPNGGTFTLKVDNRSSKQDLVLLVDTNCARGPDYRQGVAAGQMREFSYSTYSGGSCFFERSGVVIGIKDLTKTQMHWQSGFVPAGWTRGELDGPLPSDMQFTSSQDGSATLIFAPK